MDSTQINELIAWIGAHPVAAGLVIFAAAFADALLVIGAAVPAIPIFFAVGTLVGLGSIDGTYAILCAAAGAFCGDGISYLLGRRYGERMRGMWPFSRYPQWLDSGARLFERHGLKGVLIARYLGAVRPFVPAIAGMLAMPGPRYALASSISALSWAILFIVPGWAFGASLEAISAIAGRFAILLLVVLGVLLGVGWLIVRGYGFAAPRTTDAIEAALAWSHRHPRLGRWSRGLIDPQHPESTSLALLALMLIGVGATLLWLSLALAGADGRLLLDIHAESLVLQLRSPLADPLMAALCSLGSWTVLAPLAAVMTLGLAWSAGRKAALHWLAVPLFAWSAEWVLRNVHVTGSGSGIASMLGSTASLTFLAILLTRELGGRRHAWPYLLAGLQTTLVLLAQLYLGNEQLSVLLIETGLGLSWGAVLGLAYRSHAPRIPHLPAMTAVYAALLVLGAGWHASANGPRLLEMVRRPDAVRSVDQQAWQDHAWLDLPGSRNDFTTLRSWPLNLQYAGDLQLLAGQLEGAGWRRVEATGWWALLSLLNGSNQPGTTTPLSAAHQGRNEQLLMTRPGGQDDVLLVLRWWPSPLQLEDGRPVWQGNIGEMRFEERLRLFRGWFQTGSPERASAQLRASLPGWPSATRAAPGAGEVLLLQAPAD